MKQLILLFILALTLTLNSCSKSSSPYLTDLAAKIEGTYEGSLDSGTSDFVITQVKLTKVDALTVSVEHMNATPVFSKFNLSLEEVNANEITDLKSPWQSAWKSNSTQESLKLENITDGIFFSGSKK